MTPCLMTLLPTKRMMSKTIEEILAPKPEVRLRVYAYAISETECGAIVVSGL